MDRIVNENYIWDLHIHTCKCPKSSGKFHEMDSNQYVDGLVECFKNYKDLKMISFTDHNYMSSEIYNLFNEKKTNITLIPGIEVDVIIDSMQKKSYFKQIIVYFDTKSFKIDAHSEKINDYLKNNTPVKIYDFLNFLITKIRVPFLLSPHFMKQGKRAIDYNWDTEEAKKNIDKYIDQMFCFWETSSIKNIQYAIQFLKDFNREDRVSIISFSDSHDFATLKNYLDNPNQYFLSLPSFNGMRMVGSDCRRISNKKELILDKDKGKYFGEIDVGSQKIKLSNKLNVVIGGRGSGKSILLDGIFICKPENKEKVNRKRLPYVLNRNIKVFDMNSKAIASKNFEFDYYNQGYINKLFDDNNDIVDSIYFEKEFNALEDFNTEVIKGEIISDFDFDKKEDVTQECNICSLSQNIVKIVSPRQEVKIRKVKCIKKLDITSIFEGITKSLNRPAVTPKELKYNVNIINCKNELIKIVMSEVSKYNKDIIEKSEFHNNVVNFYKEKLNEKDDIRRLKSETIGLFESKFEKLSNPYINRVKVINAIIDLNSKERNISHANVNPIVANGNDKFTFVKELIVEKPIYYLLRKFIEYFDSNKCIKKGFRKDNIHDLGKMINNYCYGENDLTMESKRLSDLDSELFELKGLKLDVLKKIFYEHNNEKKDIRYLSPGSKANLLMEYIVFKDTSIPLILDQPEDNIDNRTIYTQLTNWFNSLKNKRQLIIATHDANIVINADAENVIMCNQKTNDNFIYDYGSLEHGDMLDDVAELLEGGRKAIERRLLKYGEKEEDNDSDNIV